MRLLSESRFRRTFVPSRQRYLDVEVGPSGMLEDALHLLALHGVLGDLHFIPKPGVMLGEVAVPDG